MLLLTQPMKRAHQVDALAQETVHAIDKGSAYGQKTQPTQLRRTSNVALKELDSRLDISTPNHTPRRLGGPDWRLDQVSSPDDTRCWNQSSQQDEGSATLNFDVSIWPLARRHATVLEFFQGSTDHGDICREQATGEYFCPEGCDLLKGPPWCGLKVRLLHCFNPCYHRLLILLGLTTSFPYGDALAVWLRRCSV